MSLEHFSADQELLATAIRENLTPDAVRLISARLLGFPDPEPQDEEDDSQIQAHLEWFGQFLARLA